MDALPDFELLRPTTLGALLAARLAHPQASLLGGGTDLLVNIRRGIVAPKILIEVNCAPLRRMSMSLQSGRR
jgi:4-hydroxybenzoyl-CoA reductase subunit beta